MELDKDLLARQEARRLAKLAEKAQVQLADMTQAQLDKIVEFLTSVRQHYAHECSVLTAMMLCKFMCQIRDARRGRRAIAGIVILACLTICLDTISTFALQFVRYAADLQQYVYIDTLMGLAVTFANSVIWTILVGSLVKSVGISPWLWAVAGVRWYNMILSAVSAFEMHHGLSAFYAVSGGILGLAALLLMLILLHRHHYPHEHEEFV